MNPAIWGPPFWFILHSIALNYPERPTFIERRNHFEFFRNLQNVIPCEECRKNYAMHFRQYPLTPFLDSRQSLLQWTIIMHNLVNRMHGASTMTTDEVTTLYRNVYDESATHGHQERDAARLLADRYCATVPRHADGTVRCSCRAREQKTGAPNNLRSRLGIALSVLGGVMLLAVIGVVIYRHCSCGGGGTTKSSGGSGGGSSGGGGTSSSSGVSGGGIHGGGGGSGTGSGADG